MKVILLRGNDKAPIKFNFGVWHFVVPALIMINIVLLIQFSFLNSGDDNDLSHRVALIEAQTQRLNMLGSYIAKQTKVDIGSFSLSEKPALGGILGQPKEPESENSLLESIRKSELFLSKQKTRLKTLLPVSQVLKTKGRGRYLNPVKTGYVSSKYGMRNDPINGTHRFHKGIDIAGKKGTPIETIASGFVTFVGRKGGYGNVVEIHHSDSLKSRYAHLDSTFVKKGSVVHQGDEIAALGNTGRVTGPHLHLEVWKDGKAVNPEKYINLALGHF